MKRYHFSIEGSVDSTIRGKLGIAGALYATTDEEAVSALQSVLDCYDLNPIENKCFTPREQYKDGLIDYLQLCINDTITVTIDDFDEIVEVDEDTSEEIDDDVDKEA